MEKVDLIIHGGDLFFRSVVANLVVDKAFEPLVAVASAGIPVYLVPGNHERSRFPGHLWLAHENIHVFDRPRTFRRQVGSTTIALSGFPFTRRVKGVFPSLLHQAGFFENRADIHLLCMHQTVEGARVGPKDFTFRAGPDNIPGADIPPGFTVVLSGHIHRAQQLTHTLDNQPFTAPVIYPGSTERTSFAERFENKYYVIITIDPSSTDSIPVFDFHPLLTRPMSVIEIPVRGVNHSGLKALIRDNLKALDPDSIIRIKLTGPGAEEIQASLSAGDLRSLAPPTMNISIARTWANVPNRPQTY